MLAAQNEFELVLLADVRWQFSFLGNDRSLRQELERALLQLVLGWYASVRLGM